MKTVRIAPLLISALTLSACAGAPVSDALGRYAVAGSGVEVALASLAASAGRVVAIRSRGYANGLSQEVILDGPRIMAGENRITVQAVTGQERRVQGETLSLGPPTAAAIAAETEALFPGMTMRVASAIERNPQGPFEYAVGSSGALTCVYAWQYIAPAQALTLLEGASGTGAHPVSLRVRLCRKGAIAALVADLRGLTLVRPGESAAVAEKGPSGGDALDAAVGPLAALQPVTLASGPGGAVQRAAESSTDRHDDVVPTPHRHVRRLAQAARHGALRRQRPSLSRGTLPEASRAPQAARVPRLPLPDDVGVGAGTGVTVPARMSATVSTLGGTRAASIGDEAMPLPH